MRMRRGGISWRCLSERFRVLPSVMSQRRAWPRPAIRHSPEERDTQEETENELMAISIIDWRKISYALLLLRNVCFLVPLFNSTNKPCFHNR